MSRIIDHTGQTFGLWTVLERAPGNGKRAQWLCRCACGAERVVDGGNLRGGYSKSCGCIRDADTAQRARERNYKHGHAIRGGLSSEYSSWSAMWARCTYENTNSSEHYLGRGITVCDRWKSFENFLADMGQKPTPKHSIDRIDVNETTNPATVAGQRRENKRGIVEKRTGATPPASLMNRSGAPSPKPCWPTASSRCCDEWS